ncbi:MAG: hypothetical protein KGZ93_02695 [Actinobacteria bacterium]|nr:hypothetical protein [Actinomycetota bacterium]
MKKTFIPLIISLLIMAGCADSPVKQEQTEATVKQKSSQETQKETAKPAPVELAMSAAIEGDTLFIKGTANLPDGAVLSYDIRHEGLATRTDVPLENLQMEGTVEVKTGAWTIMQPLTGWPKGELELWVAFMIVPGAVDQPKEISNIYGETGENIKGDQSRAPFREDAGIRQAEIESKIKY